MSLRFTKKWLDIPSLSQGNSRNPKDDVWCGRTSGSMIYNYYQMVKGAGAGSLIVNNRSSAPYDLLYPDGSIAAAGFAISEPIKRAASGWEFKKLYPKGARAGFAGAKQIRTILNPVFNALNRNNPVLAYTGISTSDHTPRHIIVISGYKLERGQVWLLIDDPATMRDVEGYAGDKPSMLGLHNLEVLEPGAWQKHGARYWVRARRLFEPNDFSGIADDLWCDHSDRNGFQVWINETTATPMSEHAHNVSRVAGLPVDIREPADGAITIQHLWKVLAGSPAPFPIGRSRTWHNGVHIMKSGLLAGPRALAFAPGEILVARLGATSKTGEDASCVLIRHRFDPSRLTVLEPLPAGAETPEHEKDAVCLYSLLMHLAPRSALLDAGGRATDDAPPWIAELGVVDPPAKRVFFPQGVAATPLTWTKDGDDYQAIPLAIAERPLTLQEYDKDGTLHEVDTADGTFFALPRKDRASNIESWSKKPAPPMAMPKKGRKLHYWNPATSEMVETNKTFDKPVPLVSGAADVGAMRELEILDESGETSFARVETRENPGFILTGESFCYHDRPPGVGTSIDAGDYPVLFDNRKSVSLYVDVRSSGAFKGGAQKIRASTGPLIFQNVGVTKVRGKERAWPKLIPCVRLGASEERAAVKDAAAGDPAYAWRNSTLRYLNPATGVLISTKKTIRSRSPIATSAADPKRLDYVHHNGEPVKSGGKPCVRITIHESPGMFLNRKRSCLHETAEYDEKLRDTDQADFPVLRFNDKDAKLFLRTLDRGTRRYFSDGKSERVTLKAADTALSFVGVERARAGPRKKKDRAWPRLIPCLPLSAEEKKEAEEYLKKVSESPAGQLLTRLELGQSCLYGVQIGRKDGWRVDEDGLITPTEARLADDDDDDDPEDYDLKMFSRVAGTGRRRWFPEPRRSPVDSSDPPVYHVASRENVKIWPVELFKSGSAGRQRALIEVMLALPDGSERTNETDLWFAEKKAAFRKKTRDALMKGEGVDIAGLETPEIDKLKSGATGNKALVDRDVGYHKRDIALERALIELRKRNTKKEAAKKRLDKDLKALDEREKGLEASVKEQFEARVLSFADYRRVTRDPVGLLGAVPGGGAKGKAAPGLHVEVFSAGNVVDPDTPGADQKLESVGKTGWMTLRNDATDELLNWKKFFQKMLAEILKHPEVAARVGKGSPPSEALGSGVMTPAEWLAFCRKHERFLSRIIAAHPSEWGIAWDEIPPGYYGKGRTKKLKEALEHLAWWPDGFKLDGPGDGGLTRADSMFFYHPLRMVEWLATGLDVEIVGRKDAADIKVEIPERGETTTLERDPASLAYPYRTIVAERGAVKDHVRARVTVPTSVMPANNVFDVRLRQGELFPISLQVPALDVSVQKGQPQGHFGIPVVQRAVPGTATQYLLADGHAKLADCGYSRATIQAEMHFNIEAPTDVSLAIEGSGFYIESFRATGADLVDGPDGAGSLADGSIAGRIGGPEVKLKLETPPLPKDALSIQSRTMTVVVEVAASGDINASANLVVSASGGDFGGEKKKKVALATREIKSLGRGTKITKGEDIAKVQLYLSQMTSTDGGMCYRPEPDKKGRTGKTVVYGKYGPLTRRSLARFIVTFSKFGEWKSETVRITNRSGGGETEVRREDFVAAFGPELEGVNTNRWPIVDASLLEDIIEFYRLPYIIPQVLIRDVTPEIDFSRASLPVRIKVKGKGNTRQRTMILASPGSDAIEVEISCPDRGELGGDMQVVLDLPEDSAYRISESGNRLEAGAPEVTSPLSDACRTWLLVPNSDLEEPTRDKEDNTLVVRTGDGIELGKIILGGSRDIDDYDEGFGRDAALLQYHLSQIGHPEAPGEGLLRSKSSAGPIVDGGWGKASKAALELFLDHNAEDEDDFEDPGLIARLIEVSAG